ncbi:N-acetylmuramoyl-L-alanine amidase [Piscibacillus sp. B03]|uniref:N-acetylmuramoyl-L-alanine amidase n=1 Tax=Piscibacillus sp. B03 TaxID=3457430 RepID=UPI003FCE2078
MKLYTKVLLVLSLVLIFSMSLTVQADEAPIYEVTADYLNVREEPSLEGRIVAVLEKGDQVRVFDENDGWVKTYYNEEEVWISTAYLKEVKEDVEVNEDTEKVKVNVENAHIRSGSSVEHSVVGYAQFGDTFYLLDSENDWHKIKLEDEKVDAGWIASFLTERVDEEEVSEEEVEQLVEGAFDNIEVVLDIGHGGKDGGAVSGGILEKDLLLDTGLAVAEKLEEAGISVTLTRDEDQYVSLDDRVEISRKQDPDVFISLHYDSYHDSSVNGTTVFYHQDKELAESFKNAMSEHTSLKSRDSKKALYKVLTNNQAPSVLMELGFVTNANDLSIIQTEEYYDQVAEAIKHGLMDYFE